MKTIAGIPTFAGFIFSEFLQKGDIKCGITAEKYWEKNKNVDLNVHFRWKNLSVQSFDRH